MLTKDQVIQLLRRNQSYLSSKYGVKRIGLFGSYARGQPDEESDVDIFVEFERPIGLKFVEFAEELEMLFGQKVDVLTPAGIQRIRIRHVARDIEEGIIYV